MTVPALLSRPSHLSRLPHLLLTAGPLLACGLAQAGPMQDIGNNSGPQCAGMDVNNSGYVVGACAEPDGSASGFVAQTPGNALELARLATARNCAALGITNIGRIVGNCLNSDSLPTAVVWNAGSPSTLQALQPVLGDMRARPAGFNHAGVVAGVSISANNTVRPVMWRNNETNARTLPAGLLGLDATNCAPSDVDAATTNPAMPNIAGNCPGTNGRPQPILWSAGPLGTYASTALMLPSGALYCTTSHAVAGRILGNCDFGAQGGRAVLWSNPAVAPLVLSTNPSRNRGRDLNSNGAVIGSYMNSNGDSIPFYWDTTTNTRTDIPPLSGGFRVSAVDIGNNGVVVGTSDLSDGSSHAIRWTLSGGTVDLGTLPGGENSAPMALSQDGCYLTGGSEVGAGRDTHAFLQNLCVP